MLADLSEQADDAALRIARGEWVSPQTAELVADARAMLRIVSAEMAGYVSTEAPGPTAATVAQEAIQTARVAVQAAAEMAVRQAAAGRLALERRRVKNIDYSHHNWARVSLAALGIVRRLLAADAGQRPTAAALLSEPWLRAEHARRTARATADEARPTSSALASSRMKAATPSVEPADIRYPLGGDVLLPLVSLSPTLSPGCHRHYATGRLSHRDGRRPLHRAGSAPLATMRGELSLTLTTIAQ